MYFNNKKDLILGEEACGDNVWLTYIPAKHVKIAYDNLKKGKDYSVCSPVYEITREIAAFILCYYKEEL